jgi:hypothetical protein
MTWESTVLRRIALELCHVISAMLATNANKTGEPRRTGIGAFFQSNIFMQVRCGYFAA